MNHPRPATKLTGRQKIPGQRVRGGGGCNGPRRYIVKPHIPAQDPTPEPYWEGPYQMLVPSHIQSVPYKDGGNVMYRDGVISDTYVDPKLVLSKDKYLGRFATYGKDGQWYYTPNRKPFGQKRW
jgi:hypothetical protein